MTSDRIYTPEELATLAQLADEVRRSGRPVRASQQVKARLEAACRDATRARRKLA